jgi:uncharacterized repeat protein (TIGR02543 family)
MLSRFLRVISRENIARFITAALVLGMLQIVALTSPAISVAANPGSMTFTSGSYVSAPSAQNFTSAGDWTIEGYYKPEAPTTGRSFLIGYSGVNGDVEELQLYLGPAHYWTGSARTTGQVGLYQYTNMISSSDDSTIWNHFVFQQNSVKACGVVQRANLTSGAYTWPTRNETWNCYGGSPRHVGTNNKITKWVVGAAGSMSNVRVSNIARYSFDSNLPAPTSVVGADANTLFLIGNDDSASNYLDSTGNLTFTKTGTVGSGNNNPGLAPVVDLNHSVTYNLGGGSGTLPTQSPVTEGSSFSTAASTGLSRVGYTFNKWNDGTNNYSAGANYVMSTSDVTLTAQWTINTYAVSFSAGLHGTITGTSTQTINHGSSTTPVTATPDANYHFVSWSDASTSNPRTISSVETTTSLTATFAIDTYTATYTTTGNGTISGISIQTINHGESTTAVTAVPNAHYHFTSWNDGFLTETRTDTALIASISKVAQFSIDTHTIIFDANGGTGGTTSNLNHNVDAIASAPTVTKSQYTFAGWAETITATSINSWTVVGSKTLYSLWTPKVYTITYLPESGTATVSTETFTVGASPITLQLATRVGYKFNGWFTSKSGGTLIGTAGAQFTPTDTATVHAQWIQASLVGLSSPTSFGTIVATNGNDGGISATRSGTKAEIEYFADSLPDGTIITAYLQGNTVYAASQLTGVSNLLLSVVVAWKALDETVPLVDPTKNAIRLKITNSDIKSGAKVYSIVGDTSTVLTTATQDGYVVIDLREDPEIVIANPVVVPAPTIVVAPTPAPTIVVAPTPAPTMTVAVVAPALDPSIAEAEIKAKLEAETKLAAELKVAQDLAEAELKAAREKQEQELKVALAEADAQVARLKAEADSQAAAELKAIEDAALATAKVQKKIVPNVTLYSISPSLKLSRYDRTHLNKYVSTLKAKSTVTCIGYIYTKNATASVAKLRASKQATAICAMIKSQKKTITTKVLLYPSWKAPKAAAGAKWVAVSYRVDGFKS